MARLDVRSLIPQNRLLAAAVQYLAHVPRLPRFQPSTRFTENSRPPFILEQLHHWTIRSLECGGDFFREMLLHHGVKHTFGYPGSAILLVFDAIYNSKHFDFRAMLASGTSGVVLVTSGPGVTDVITPPRDALSDGVPPARVSRPVLILEPIAETGLQEQNRTILQIPLPRTFVCSSGLLNLDQPYYRLDIHLIERFLLPTKQLGGRDLAMQRMSPSNHRMTYPALR
ncbi:hypothetical protein BS47DRAFT_1481402 [Hydnum rufescens UP504]|uniref:Uncharacterized protein n=1 Tax=Hydnum rufescens UP504 TaxID=1448309 RepID=A0A9P6BAM6_9AGAM|nr:hypothetical protein BS47DRAFT_1481402 [Hydnum rufescens UP504]